jgi:hypothetical protein
MGQIRTGIYGNRDASRVTNKRRRNRMKSKLITAQDAVKLIKDGDSIVVGGLWEAVILKPYICSGGAFPR